MKLKEGFLLRRIAGRIVVIPTAGMMNSNLMICLNETGRFLWEMLEKGASLEEMKAALMETYNVSSDLAAKDVDAFVHTLSVRGFLQRENPDIKA